VVIAGAGLAGLRTAEALRREGFDGSLVLLGAEHTPPYDRPPLSKEVLTGAREANDTIYRPEAHYASLEVDLRLGRPAGRLDLRNQTVLAGEEQVPFDRLVVATGSRPRTLGLGGGLDGVHVLRTIGDAVRLRELFAARPRVVIVGAGFIGAEVASSARALGLDVTVIEAAPTPLARAAGPWLGEISARLHRAHGTTLICGRSLTEIGGNGHIDHVRLDDGQVIECDLLVIGVGVRPNIEWLAHSGLTLDDGLVCNSGLNAGHPAVFAAGDVARWPNELFGQVSRGEQWTNAAEQARHVARNLFTDQPGKHPFRGSNYFWSDQYGVKIQFAGISDADEARIVEGSPEEFRFIAYYRKGQRLVGAFAMNSPRHLAHAKRRIEGGADWNEALADAPRA
jgi:NADPH-dependent 2,4-dienoyl-CoA reductase/sulfur reductase-like enzyme